MVVVVEVPGIAPGSALLRGRCLADFRHPLSNYDCVISGGTGLISDRPYSRILSGRQR